MSCRLLQVLISACVSGSLLETIGPRESFAPTSLLPLGTTLLTGPITEKRAVLEHASEFLENVKQRSMSLWKAVSDPAVYLPVAFVFDWQAMPSPDSALFLFQTDVLGFGLELLGRLRLISSASALFGLSAIFFSSYATFFLRQYLSMLRT